MIVRLAGESETSAAFLRARRILILQMFSRLRGKRGESETTSHFCVHAREASEASRKRASHILHARHIPSHQRGNRENELKITTVVEASGKTN